MMKNPPVAKVSARAVQYDIWPLNSSKKSRRFHQYSGGTLPAACRSPVPYLNLTSPQPCRDTQTWHQALNRFALPSAGQGQPPEWPSKWPFRPATNSRVSSKTCIDKSLERWYGSLWRRVVGEWVCGWWVGGWEGPSGVCACQIHNLPLVHLFSGRRQLWPCLGHRNRIVKLICCSVFRFLGHNFSPFFAPTNLCGNALTPKGGHMFCLTVSYMDGNI